MSDYPEGEHRRFRRGEIIETAVVTVFREVFIEEDYTHESS